jgi:hypothetical protein
LTGLADHDGRSRNVSVKQIAAGNAGWRLPPSQGHGAAQLLPSRPHHTPQQIHTMKKLISLIIVGCLLSPMLMADDADSRQILVGTWVFSTTRTPPASQLTNTITQEFQYHADGTFDITGEFVVMAPTNTRPATDSMFVNGTNGTSVTTEVIEYPYRRQIGGSGIWRIEQGYFYSTFTNNTGAWRVESGTRTYIVTNLDNRVSFYTRPTGMENRDEIISITRQDFTTRDRLGRVQTATRKQ